MIVGIKKGNELGLVLSLIDYYQEYTFHSSIKFKTELKIQLCSYLIILNK